MNIKLIPVAALFVREDSIYKTLSGVDCYDAARNALTWPGGCPVVAHPPCRLWGSLRGLSKAPKEEKALALWAVNQVRTWSGVLEHPKNSTLWESAKLPIPGKKDYSNGFTFAAPQWWWGHRANKMTWFYICGMDPSQMPPVPFRLGIAERVITNSHGLRSGMTGFRTQVTNRERDATPPALAAWLVEVAQRCHPACKKN